MKNYLKKLLNFFTEVYNQFIDDKGLKMAAALSYYAAFSIGPLLIIVIAIAGLIFGEEAARGELTRQITSLMGKDGAVMVETIVKGAADKSAGIIATIIGVVLLVLGAIGVFLELQESLNIIWGIERKQGAGIWGFIKNRLVSFSMVIATGFLLMISLVINSGISLLYNYFGNVLGTALPILDILNNLSSFVVISILFAFIFKYLPDVIIPWKYVWFGAILTSALFAIGKYLIGLYLGNSSYSSTYGAAASLVILFVWIYYSGLILFFGAEITQVYAQRNIETPLKADAEGVRIPKVTELLKNVTDKDKRKTKQTKYS